MKTRKPLAKILARNAAINERNGGRGVVSGVNFKLVGFVRNGEFEGLGGSFGRTAREMIGAIIRNNVGVKTGYLAYGLSKGHRRQLTQTARDFRLDKNNKNPNFLP